MARIKSPARLERILDAAADALLELGYRRTRLAEVAKRARVSVGTLYLYADSKESLFELVLRQAFGEEPPDLNAMPFEGSAGDDLIAWLWGRFNDITSFPVLEAAAASPRPEDPLLEMEHVLREIWAWVSKHWQALELIERCAQDWPELHLLFYKQFRRGVFGLATSLIQRRMDEGALRRYSDAATVVRVVAESVAFFAMHRHIRPDSSDLDEDTCRETVIAMLLAGFALTGGSTPRETQKAP
jgi:AcrR family transcriptional regulator